MFIPDYIGADNKRRPIRHANEFWDHYGVLVHEESVQKGDLVFFSRTGLFPTHIGIVSGSDEYIHSPGKDGTSVERAKISSREDPKPIEDSIYVKNPIGYKSPTVSLKSPTYRYHQKLV